jgi:mannose-6-phosphate isomerase-like protein (cupin superfamily)
VESDRVGARRLRVRAQNFATEVTTVTACESLALSPTTDEQALLVMDGTVIEVVHEAGSPHRAEGPALVIIPPGEAHVRVERGGVLVRIQSTRAHHVVDSINSDSYAIPDRRVRRLDELPECARAEPLRVIPMAGVPEVPGRLGRIFRTESLMINWFAPQDGPRDTDQLSPHLHEDFDQASLTLEGRFIHHIRQPWTTRLRDWRADEHVEVASPSVTIIPPGNIHTTRAIGDGMHQLIDVFAPPRADFIDKGWVLNQGDYGRA